MDVENLKLLVNNSSNVVFFGGAGVSTESNIPDFRSSSGLYKTKDNYSYPPETMLSHSFFINHTEDFYSFYREKMIYKDAQPNAAHYSLSKLEKNGKLKAIITQNIDGLHQAAGSKNVLELHGSIHRNYCTKCNKSFGLQYVINSSTNVPLCDNCGGIIKPDVVLYEESLDSNIIQQSINYIQNADVLIVGGTSLVVYPAAGMIRYYNGDKLVLINKSSTSYDSYANLIYHDSIGKVLSNIL